MSIGVGLYSQGVKNLESKDTVNKQTEFQKVTSTTPEQETEILTILKECGLEEVESITADELLNDVNEDGEKGYRIRSNGINNIILYLKSDKSINMVRYADIDLYSNGETLISIDDIIVTQDEATVLQMSCEESISSVLKSPSTAKFPNIKEWHIWKDDKKIYVQSYVDSQNSFGAELRSEFQFILSLDGYTIKSLIFDGEEYINE